MEFLNTWKEKNHIEPVRVFMGWGVVVKDDIVDLLDALRAYMGKAVERFCAQCFPCRNGLKKIALRLALLCQGVKHTADVHCLSALALCVKASARFASGQTSQKPLLHLPEQTPYLLQTRKVTTENHTSFVIAPCKNACSGHINIPHYIEKIRFHQLDEGFLCCTLHAC